MKRILLVLAITALLLPTWQRAKAADVSVDFFYNNLSGGSWIEVADYGYCWQPDVVVSNTSWRPYSDGYWAYTDVGWTWVSYEDFGWATYHYGRWTRLADHGWMWVPGRDEDLEWGPAWVSWRTGGDHIGWAPLPPRAGVRFAGGTISGRVDIDFDIGPSYYNFVPVRYIGEPVLRDRIVNVNQNVTYINQTVNVTNITTKNKVVYNYGPDVNVINRQASRPIQRLKLERQENADVSAAAKSGALTKVQGDKLMVAAPSRITKSTQAVAPPAVKTKVAKANVDRGWSGVSDPKAQAEMKERMRTEDPKKVPPPTGAAETGQAAGGSSPAGAAPATAETSPTDFGRGKGKGKRGEKGQPDPAAAAAGSPSSEASPATAAASPDDLGKGRGKGKRGEKAQPEATSEASPAAAGATDVERGKGKRDGRKGRPGSADQPPDSTGAAPAGEPSGAEGEMGRGRGKGKGKQDEPQMSPSGAPQSGAPAPGDLSSDRGQGKRKGRGAEETGAAPGAGSERQATGPEGRGRKGRGEAIQPSGGQPAGGEEGSKRGKGKKKEAEEAVPSPSPQ